MARAQVGVRAKKPRHLRRNLVFLVVALLAISLFTLVQTGLLSNRYGCFGSCGTMPHVSSVSCYSVNKTCQITLTGFTAQNVASLKDPSCGFVLIPYVNQTSSVFFGSTLHGFPTIVSIPPDTSVSFYCAYPNTPSSGQQVDGYVMFSNGYSAQFSSIWN